MDNLASGTETNHTHQPIRVCFLLLNAYALFNPRCQHVFGGAEVRGYLFATHLAQFEDFQVSVVVRDHGQPPIEKHGNVTVVAHPAYPINPNWRDRYRAALIGKVKRIRYFPFFRVTSLNPYLWYKAAVLGVVRSGQLLMQYLPGAPPRVKINHVRVLPEKFCIYDTIDADIYCHPGINNQVAELAAYCKTVQKPFIFLQAVDFVEDYTPPEIDCFIIQHAAHVIAQTEKQVADLQQYFRVHSTLIQNPIPILHPEKDILPLEKRAIVFWVGRSNEIKNPLLMLDLAAKFPETSFVMVMNPQDNVLHQQVRLQKPPNVTIYNFVPAVEIEDLFAQARVFVSTSSLEGFPNAFLQAAKYQTPILSLHVDPNHMLTQHQAGIHAAGDFQQLVDGLQQLLHDDAIASFYGRKARQYVITHHDLQAQVEQLADILRTVYSSQAMEQHQDFR